MKTKITVFLCCVVLFACKKDNIVLDSNLTSCPINTTCSYSYYDNADISQQAQPVSGNYKAFLYKNVNTSVCDATTLIHFKTLPGNTEFTIDANQIAAGQLVGYDFICACCEDLTQKPIGGNIKGKRTDSKHWLINATIIMGTLANKPLDTITVNQNFTVGNLP